MQERGVDPFYVAVCTVGLVVAFQIFQLRRWLATKSVARNKKIAEEKHYIRCNERGSTVLQARHGDIIQMSMREEQFAAGALRNGGYKLSFGFTLKHSTGGVLDLKLVGECLSGMQSRHPLLRCKVVEFESSIALQVDHNLTIPVVAVPSSKTSIQELWHHHRQMKLNFGESLFSLLWVYDTEKTEVVLMAQHAVADGRSLATLVHEFLSRYASKNQIQLEDLPLVPSCDTVAKHALWLNPWSGIVSFWRAIATAIKGKGAFAFPIVENQTETFLKLRENTPIGLTSHLPKELSAKLLAECKLHKVSVTAFLGAVLMYASADLEGSSELTKITLGTVADSRPLGTHVIDPENVSLFATSLPLFTATIVKGSTSIWKTAEEYGQHLAECTIRRDGILLGIIMGFRMRKMMRAPRLTLGRPTVILSNSGIFPRLQSKYGDHLEVEIAHVTSNQLYSFPKVSTSTLNGVLTLNFDGVAPIHSHEDMCRLQERALHYIKSIAMPDSS